jgi:hypothetical protein
MYLELMPLKHPSGESSRWQETWPGGLRQCQNWRSILAFCQLINKKTVACGNYVRESHTVRRTNIEEHQHVKADEEENKLVKWIRREKSEKRQETLKCSMS